MILNKCDKCGIFWYAKGGKKRYCEECKKATDACPVCGKAKSVLKKVCSRACSNKLWMSTKSNPFSRPEIKSKIAKTCLDRHGGIGFASKTINNKIASTMKETHGVEHNSQMPEHKEKVSETCQARYMHKHYLGSDKYYEDLKSNLGVDNVFKLEKVKNTIKQTMLANHGVSCALDLPNSRKSSINYRKEHQEEVFNKTNETCQARYGVDWPCQTKQAVNSSTQISKINLWWKKCTEEIGYQTTLEKHVGKYSYDLYVEKLNLLIEINPTRTHQSTENYFLSFGKVVKTSIDYHINKYNNAINSGYNCIMIWDWDDPALVLSLLEPKEEVRLKSCTISEIPTIEAERFLQATHLQGSVSGQKVCIGLKHRETLIAVMTFGTPRYTNKHEWEWLRYSSSRKVHRAASNMLAYFITKYTPKSILSYSDRSKFGGGMFKSLGFSQIGRIKPSKHYYNSKTNTHFTDNLVRKLGACTLLGIPNETRQLNSEGQIVDNQYILLREGFVEIYDCGQATYIWRSK